MQQLQLDPVAREALLQENASPPIEAVARRLRWQREVAATKTLDAAELVQERQRRLGFPFARRRFDDHERRSPRQLLPLGEDLRLHG